MAYRTKAKPRLAVVMVTTRFMPDPHLLEMAEAAMTRHTEHYIRGLLNQYVLWIAVGNRSPKAEKECIQEIRRCEVLLRNIKPVVETWNDKSH